MQSETIQTHTVSEASIPMYGMHKHCVRKRFQVQKTNIRRNNSQQHKQLRNQKETAIPPKHIQPTSNGALTPSYIMLMGTVLMGTGGTMLTYIGLSERIQTPLSESRQPVVDHLQKQVPIVTVHNYDSSMHTHSSIKLVNSCTKSNTPC